MGRLVQVTAQLLHFALHITHVSQPYVEAWDFHTCIHHTLLELMTTGRTETHGDHSITNSTLKMMSTVIRGAIQWLQFTLAHATETDLLMAEIARNGPIRACVGGPFLRMTRALNTPVITSTIYLRVNCIKGKRIIILGGCGTLCIHIGDGGGRRMNRGSHAAENGLLRRRA